jgi:transposase InsO family protein
MNTPEQRKLIIDFVEEAGKKQITQKRCCEYLEINPRNLQRWKKNLSGDKRKGSTKVVPHKLTEEEKEQIVRISCSEEYCDLSPNEIVPALAEKGIYIASERSFYRVLQEKGLLKERTLKRAKRKTQNPEKKVTTGPDQLYSWDITYLPTEIKGIFYYLYIVIDVWSRKIVSHSVHEEDNQIHSKDLIIETMKNNNAKEIVFHSDNGPSVKNGTVLALYNSLGITPSYSRPSVSTDNAFSESLFSTCKYVPFYPGKFENIEHARIWTDKFVNWYNNEHRHSGIKYVTPMSRHAGLDKEILKRREETYRQAKLNNPQRWSKDIRNWSHVSEVKMNIWPKKDLQNVA